MHFELQSTSKNHSQHRFVLYFALIFALTLLELGRELMIHAGMIIDSRLVRLAQASDIVIDCMLLATVSMAFPEFLREMKRRGNTAARAEDSLGKIQLLFNLTDMLQGALGHADANSVLRSTACALLPGFGGALYIFNNSGDRLELSTSWQWPDATPLSETISPSDCWALKRGKAHFNLTGDHALCCEHQHCCVTTLEIPMMARGEIYGLLLVQRDGEEAARELEGIATAADALADAMSLSLSNLSLRERLRSQALRDALTGLYNRRYMEDALERFTEKAARTRSPLSIVMIDLDHFKRLNDEHGHAMGDVVLNEVAAAILGAIGPGDIACRYGGEELVLLLPDCSVQDGAAKAEMLRGRIEHLSDRHKVPISASFGVATVGETSEPKNALNHADKALYRAKLEGRNRVAVAPQSLRGVPEPTVSRAA